jgi:1-aminocyclopropane-1-carboxylate synthase
VGTGDIHQGLSARGSGLVASPPAAEYIRTHQERAAGLCDGPSGYVALCTAENKLVADLVLARLGAVDDVPARALGYDAMVGAEGVREKIAGFMARTFVGRPVEARHLVLLAGAGAVLESLFYAICDPGDGVLVPTPSYAGFWADLETRDDLNIIPVHCSSEAGFRLTPELLDRALTEASRPVKEPG